MSDAYAQVVRSLLILSFDGESPRALRLEPEARELFIAYYNENGQACHAAAADGEADLAAALAKLRGGAARIALVTALARAAETGTAATAFAIGPDSMAAGIAIARWFEAEARRIYSGWGAAEAEHAASRERGSLTALADRLERILQRGAKTLDQLHDATGKNLSAAQLRSALLLLQSGGRAQVTRFVGPRGGRPREQWEVSP